MYELGHDTEPIEAENWIIRWMLWHVERNRTNRISSSRAPRHEADPVQVSPHGSEATVTSSSARPGTLLHSAAASILELMMDTWTAPGERAVRTLTTVVTVARAVPATAAATATTLPNLYPYDPVRDR